MNEKITQGLIGIAIALFLLVACAPVALDLSPQELGRRVDALTNTAGAIATQGSFATATRIAKLEADDDKRKAEEHSAKLTAQSKIDQAAINKANTDAEAAKKLAEDQEARRKKEAKDAQDRADFLNFFSYAFVVVAVILAVCLILLAAIGARVYIAQKETETKTKAAAEAQHQQELHELELQKRKQAAEIELLRLRYQAVRELIIETQDVGTVMLGEVGQPPIILNQISAPQAGRVIKNAEEWKAWLNEDDEAPAQGAPAQSESAPRPAQSAQQKNQGAPAQGQGDWREARNQPAANLGRVADFSYKPATSEQEARDQMIVMLEHSILWWTHFDPNRKVRKENGGQMNQIMGWRDLRMVNKSWNSAKHQRIIGYFPDDLLDRQAGIGTFIRNKTLWELKRDLRQGAIRANFAPESESGQGAGTTSEQIPAT